MNKTLLILLFLYFNISTSVGQAVQKKDGSSLKPPKIIIVYLKGGTPFDKECGRAINKPIHPEEIDEVATRLKEFQELWDKDGPEYIETVLREIKVAFPYQEMQATLTVCDFSSMSSPLLINVRRFLSKSEKTLPTWAFSEILFHEIMHTYTRRVYDKSVLRKKYSNEPQVILNHLHSMALEKLALVKLNKSEILEWLDNRYRNLFGPDYKRAWEIVNDIEGYENFVAELKLMD